MSKEKLSADSFKVGTKIKIGPKYSKEMGGFESGEIIELVECWFEHENGLYVEDTMCPGINPDDDPDSIYHLFGNNFEYWYDCEIINP